MIDTSQMTQQQEKVIKALLTCKTKRQASQAAGVSEATLYRLLKNPQFVQMLETVKKQVYYNVVFNLASLSQDSVSCLDNLISSPTTRPSVKCKASSFVIDKLLNVANYERLERRISRLEQINGIDNTNSK